MYPTPAKYRPTPRPSPLAPTRNDQKAKVGSKQAAQGGMCKKSKKMCVCDRSCKYKHDADMDADVDLNAPLCPAPLLKPEYLEGK
jgi:hypothetical protein